MLSNLTPVSMLIIVVVAAHTVVIKGVKIFQNNASQEYSDLDIMQMMGRAVSWIFLDLRRISLMHDF